MTWRKLFAIAVLPLLVGLAGCTVEAPPAGVVYVRHAPPAARAEAIERSPGPDYVWIAGHHAWVAGTWVWSPGHWERRPRPHAHWVAGRWRHNSHGWYWVEGNWRS